MIVAEPVRDADLVWPDCCSCKAGDGTDECPQYDACYEAWSRFIAAEVNRSRAALTKAMDNYRRVFDGTHSDGDEGT